MKIHTKIAAGYLLSVLLIISVAAYSNHVGQQLLLEDVGQHSLNMARQLINRIGHELDMRIAFMASALHDGKLKKVLVESNQRFGYLKDRDAYIAEQDQVWQNPACSQFVDTLFSTVLRDRFVRFFKTTNGTEFFREVFVTNRYGTVVGQTNPTSDYFQADEPWWQKAKENSIHIDDIHYDDSAGTHGLAIALRIDDRNGEFLGVIKAVVPIISIIRTAQIHIKLYETTKIELLTCKGIRLFNSRPAKLFVDVSNQPIFSQLKERDGYFLDTKHFVGSKLITYADSTGIKSFRGLDWILVLEHDEREILSKNHVLQKRIFYIAALVVLLALAVAWFITKSIVDPIHRLRDASLAVANGDFKKQVSAKGRNEVDQLARTFNQMTARLDTMYTQLRKEITEREKAQAQIKENEERLSLAFKATNDGIWDLDLFSNEVYISSRLKELTGIDSNKTNTAIEDWISNIHPDFHFRALRKIRTTLRDKAPFSINYLYHCANANEFRWHNIRGKAILDQNSTLYRLVGAIRDIDDRMKEDQRRAELERQLLQSEKMASIGQLAAGVAHEINNPTGYVSSNLTTLSDYQNDIQSIIKEYRALIEDLNITVARDRLSSSAKEKVARILSLESEIDIDFIMDDVSALIGDCKEGTERIKKIVLDLKDFAHPGEDDLKMVDINKGIESTLNVVWNELKYKAEVVKNYGDIPHIAGYPHQLNQVFMNILVNAAQAIEKKGIITILTSTGESHVEICISDTGPGIPAENHVKIFEPFFTTKEVGKGTGLGLNVAYNIIKKHNGTIDIESEVGKGATFKIQIPINSMPAVNLE